MEDTENILENEKTIIQTDRSFFKTYTFSNKTLIENCINDAKDKLYVSLAREVGWFSDTCKLSYTYRNKLNVLSPSMPLSESMSILLNTMNQFFNSDYNGLLINRYVNGDKYIAKHKDSKNHPENGVVIISYGATRNFRIFDNRGKCILNQPQKEFDVLHMGGDFQYEFFHDIEKDPSVTEPRYSISFHKFIGY